MLYEIVRYATLATALLAAILWFMAARAKETAGKPGSFSITGHPNGEAEFAYDGLDLRATLNKQAFWNSCGAAATAVSILLQAVLPYLQPGI